MLCLEIGRIRAGAPGAEQAARQGQFFAAGAAPESVRADLDKSLGQDVLEKAAEEFLGG